MVKMTSVWDRTSDFLRDDGARVLPVAIGLIFLPNLLSGVADGAQWVAYFVSNARGKPAERGQLKLLCLLIDFTGLFQE